MENGNRMTEAPSFVDKYMPEGTGAKAVSYDSNGLINLASIRAFLWRQRVILALVTGVVVLIGLIATMLMTPIYQATSTVRVNMEAGQIVEGQDLTDPFIQSSEVDRYLQTLAGVIDSRSMALRVVDSLKLHKNKSWMGKDAPTSPPPGTSAKQWEARQRQVAANMLMGGITVTVPNDTRIISINFRSPDPVLAARIADSYAENFLQDSLNQSVEANSYARKYLEDQIADVRGKLQNAEVQAIGYARSNRIVGSPLTGTTTSEATGEAGTAPTLTVTNLARMNQSYTDARAQRIAAEQRWQSVSGTPAAQLPEVQQNSTIQSLRTQLATLNSDLSKLRERYRDDHPDVVELQARISVIERQLQNASAEIKQSIRNAYEIARRQEDALSGELARVSDQTLDEQDRRVEYNLIDRDVQALRAQLASLLERYNQIAAAANLRSNTVTMLDAATVPGSPSSPNLMRNLLVALVLGIGLAGAIAVLREVLDDRVRSIDDVERKLGIPALGQTPYVSEKLSSEIDDQFSPISEAYSSIRATLDFSMPKMKHLVIQMTSSQASEGKTTTSVAIARKYASIGCKVLLVDMDLRRPSIARAFGHARTDVGVVDVLFSRVPLERALLTGMEENLDVLPVGKAPPNPVEILSSGLIPEFLARHREQYDVIIIDSSPVMGIADAPLLSRFADAVVFVVEANRAHFGHSRASIRRLRDLDAKIVGAVLTKFRALEAGQDYSYQYRYYTYGSQDS